MRGWCRCERWFRWLVRHNHILHNPASDLDMPRLENGCPRSVERGRSRARDDRSRTSAIRWECVTAPSSKRFTRRASAAWSWCNLKLYNVDHLRGTLSVRQGKERRTASCPSASGHSCGLINICAKRGRSCVMRAGRRDDVPEHRRRAVPSGPHEQAGARLRGAGQSRKERRVPHVAAHDGDADARRRRGHPLHPGDARPQRSCRARRYTRKSPSAD